MAIFSSRLSSVAQSAALHSLSLVRELARWPAQILHSAASVGSSELFVLNEITALRALGFSFRGPEKFVATAHRTQSELNPSTMKRCNTWAKCSLVSFSFNSPKNISGTLRVRNARSKTALKNAAKVNGSLI